ILNADDPFSNGIAARTRAKVVFAGTTDGSVRAIEIRQSADGSEFTILEGAHRCRAQLPVAGSHMVQNALLAVAAGRAFGLSIEECAAGLAAAPLTRARLQIKEIGGVHFLDDSYNANPDSMKAALRTLVELDTEGKRIAVLGEMRELGPESERGHREVGETAATLGVDHLSGQFIGFNVFLYVTFRAIAASVTAFLLTLTFGNLIIAKLRALKVGQPIRGAEEVHRLAELHGVKQGTPTMGGVLVIGAVFVSSILWARLDNKFVWLALFSMVYLGALGFADDYLKVTKKKSEGIHGRLKLLFQIILAAIITGLFLTDPLLEVQARALYVPFVKTPAIANMSWFTFVFFALIIVGASNAVNLTDGLDGLAAGCTITVAFAYALLCYAAGN